MSQTFPVTPLNEKINFPSHVWTLWIWRALNGPNRSSGRIKGSLAAGERCIVRNLIHQNTLRIHITNEPFTRLAATMLHVRMEWRL